MKAVLISIQPKWCELIASGKKTIEARKTKPKVETPFKCYIYCTKDNFKSIFQDKPYLMHNRQICNGKVIGEFVCDEIFPIKVFENGSIQDYNCHGMERSCVSYDDISTYIGKDCTGYGWHISDLVIYDKPKELREFHLPCILECDGLCEYGCLRPLKRPPQSWCYVKKEGADND